MDDHSSLFNICGDGKVSLARTIAYVCANAVNNIHPFGLRKASSGWSVVYLQQQKLAENFDYYWANVGQGSSPSRALSDLFWMVLPWRTIYDVLGGKIHILDVGCGSGRYFERLQLWTQHSISSYRGVDITESIVWGKIESANSNVAFNVIKPQFSVNDIPPKTNLIITQSAIEHFQFDTRFFCEIKKFTKKTQRPLIQIHLVPSAACLWLYLTHGYRQYTPYTVDKMTKCFSDNITQKILFPLGGRHCNRLHFSAVTLSRLTRRYRADQRNTNPELYQRRLQTAILEDLQCLSKSPSFYAIVLASYLPSPIFVSKGS